MFFLTWFCFSGDFFGLNKAFEDIFLEFSRVFYGFSGDLLFWAFLKILLGMIFKGFWKANPSFGVENDG